MRSAGREALARNFYQACGQEGYCTPDELYRFFSGFEPWFGSRDYPEEPVGGYRTLASELRDRIDQDYANTSEQLWSDVHTILGPEAAAWTTGKRADSPWQWFGPHADMNHPALVTIAYGTAQYFMMFTGDQDALFKQAIHSE